MDNDLEADFERLPTIAFGREFTHIPEHVRQNLDTLDRESAIYSDHWIEEIGDFRHLRIRFTDDERAEFARRFWAFELFIRAVTVNGRAPHRGVNLISQQMPTPIHLTHGMARLSRRRITALRHSLEIISRLSHVGWSKSDSRLSN